MRPGVIQRDARRLTRPSERARPEGSGGRCGRLQALRAQPTEGGMRPDGARKRSGEERKRADEGAKGTRQGEEYKGRAAPGT